VHRPREEADAVPRLDVPVHEQPPVKVRQAPRHVRERVARRELEEQLAAPVDRGRGLERRQDAPLALAPQMLRGRGLDREERARNVGGGERHHRARCAAAERADTRLFNSVGSPANREESWMGSGPTSWKESVGCSNPCIVPFPSPVHPLGLEVLARAYCSTARPRRRLLTHAPAPSLSRAGCRGRARPLSLARRSPLASAHQPCVRSSV